MVCNNSKIAQSLFHGLAVAARVAATLSVIFGACAKPVRAERVTVSASNPIVLRRDSLRQQVLACYRSKSGEQSLVIADDLSFRVGQRVLLKKVSPISAQKLRAGVVRKLGSMSRTALSFSSLDDVRNLRAKLSLYRQTDSLRKRCARTKKKAFSPVSAPSATYAYAMWANVDSALAGIVSAPRPWIYYSDDAESTAQALKQMPQGSRVIMDMCTSQIQTQGAVSLDARDFCTDPETERQFPCLWWDHGVAEVTPRYQAFYKNLRDAGAPLDYIALDFEAGFGTWNFIYTGEDFAAFVRSVEQDSRWPAVHRELIAAGIPAEATLADIFDFRAHQYYLAFNDVMQRRAAAYINKAFIDPARAYFPKVQASNFAYYNHRAGFPVREANGHPEWIGGGGWLVGTNQAPVAYGAMGGLTSLMLDGEHLYTATPFNAFRWNVNQIRASVLAAIAPTDFWFLPKSEGWSLYYQSDFYQEALLHALLSGAGRVLYWNPRDTSTPLDPDSPVYQSDKAVSDSINELNSLAGYTDRTSLVSGLQSWSDDFVLSCVAAHGSRICRFTPEEALTISSETGISQVGSSVVAHTAHATITFENARFEVGAATPQGVWVIQPLSAEAPKIQ